MTESKYAVYHDNNYDSFDTLDAAYHFIVTNQIKSFKLFKMTRELITERNDNGTQE